MKKFKISKSLIKNIVLYGLVGLLALGAFFAFTQPGEKEEEKPLSEVSELVRKEKVEKVVVEGNIVHLKLEDGKGIWTRKESAQSFFEILKDEKIDPQSISQGVTVRSAEVEGRWFELLVSILPVLIIVFFFWMMGRQASKMQAKGGIFSFGKSLARRFQKGKQPKITFADAAGVEEAQRELSEVVDFLKHPEKYRRLGARIPKGVLLVGPSGVGKTLLARAVANEANVPFFSVSGSEFMEMFVGVGSSRVRDLFSQAKKSAPSLIFIDELETVGRHRGFSMISQGEQEQTLNQILTEMDGFTPNDRCVVLGASNRPDLLDPALTRPGRFDRRIILTLPDLEGRRGILKIHMRGKPFSKDVDIKKLARRTVGFSGADIENMVNEAAILAAREEKKVIGPEDLEEAAVKVKLGPERKRLQSEEERKMTAYHEAGHALVAESLPHVDPVHRVSIVSRGLALGYTMIPPKIDRYNLTKTELLERIVALLGGRAAEELKFKEMTVGAAQDFRQATQIAREMVVEYGMSKLGPIAFPSFEMEEKGWPQRYLGGKLEYSEEMRAKIDQEIKGIIDSCFKRAKKILKEREKALDQAAEKLAEKETLEGEEFRSLIDSNKFET